MDVPETTNGNTAERETRIRQRAYEIWEQEGRPFGQQERHWLQAETELQEEARTVLSSRGARQTQIRRSSGAAKKSRREWLHHSEQR